MNDAPKVELFNCPKCGGQVTVRAPAHSEAVVCAHCYTILDVSEEHVRILNEYVKGMGGEPKPLIPLGTRRKFYDDMYEVIGFLVRRVSIDGTDYRWREYLLFNPYKELRWLTEYDGHWNDVQTVTDHPKQVSNTYTHRTLTFEHFQSANPMVEFVLGEFNWKVRRGDKARLNDYISPPFILSEEESGRERTWSLGRYTEPSAIWEIFKLPGRPPSRVGVFANQPNRLARLATDRRLLTLFMVVLAVVVFGIVAGQSLRQTVHRQDETFVQGLVERSRITPVFNVPGHTSNLQITFKTDVKNHWVFFSMALINDDTGTALNFGKEVSYYRGSDWSEGGQNDDIFVPSVEPGNYYLRIEPESDAQTVQYSIEVVRDVPRFSYVWYALALLAVPWGFLEYRRYAFERDRWSQSDHPWNSEE